MVTEAGESQANGSGTEAGDEVVRPAADAGASGTAAEDVGEPAMAGSTVVEPAVVERTVAGSTVVRELGDESVASYARIAPRPRKRRPTRSELLGGGDATKAPKRLAAEELHPMTGDSSGVSWDDPAEL